MAKMSEVLRRGGRGLVTPSVTSAPPAPPPPRRPVPPEPAAGGSAAAPPIRGGGLRPRPGTLVETEHERLVSYFNPASAEAKKIDMLRSQLLYPFQGVPPRTIMLTSSLPREGTSLLVANLAISFARGLQQYVMVMDCNLLHPSMHGLLGVPRQPGLTDYLEQGAEVPEIIHWSRVDKLSVIPAGRPSSRSAELLATDRMAALVEELRSRYSDRYIILDTPPLQTVDDPQVMARVVEGIVLVVLAGSTDRELVLRSLSRLPSDRVAGIVLNDRFGTVSDASNVVVHASREMEA